MLQDRRDACLFVLSIRISRIEGNVDMKQRNLYNIYVFERSGRDGASLPFLALVAFSFYLYVKKKYTYKSDIYIITDKRHLKKELENIYER